MTIANTWAVVQMDAYPEADGEADVVFNVHWTLTGSESAVVDGVDKVYAGGVYGSQIVSLDPNAPFTPYADLTEDQVINWVQNAMGAEQVASYEASVAQQIADQANPPVVTPPLPWATPA
jgi:hypothetical protein